MIPLIGQFMFCAFLAGVSLSFSVAQATPSISALNTKVIEFLNPNSDTELVIVNAGILQGFKAGMHLTAFRLVNRGSTYDEEANIIPTGTLRIVRVMDGQSIAEVLSSGSAISLSAIPRFPYIMAGDFVQTTAQEVMRRPVSLPELTLEYRRVFDDPLSVPSTFELSEAGKQLIRDEVEVFKSIRLATLVVQGFTDDEGREDANRIESTERARTVRQFLIDQLGFEPERVVAMGMGEIDPISEQRTPEARSRNRRIVIKAVSH